MDHRINIGYLSCRRPLKKRLPISEESMRNVGEVYYEVGAVVAAPGSSDDAVVPSVPREVATA